MSRESDSAILRETMRLFEIDQRRALITEGSITRNRLLVLLARKGPLTATDLVRITSLEKSWISRAVDVVVQDGLVERRPSPDDRRSHLLALTAAGQARARHIDGAIENRARSLLAELDSEQRRALIAALQPLRDVLARQAH